MTCSARPQSSTLSSTRWRAIYRTHNRITTRTTAEVAVRLAYSTLACPGRRLEDTLELGVRAGYEGVELRLIDGELIDPGMSAQDRGRGADACAKAGLPIAPVDRPVPGAAAAACSR